MQKKFMSTAAVCIFALSPALAQDDVIADDRAASAETPAVQHDAMEAEREADKAVAEAAENTEEAVAEAGEETEEALAEAGEETEETVAEAGEETKETLAEAGEETEEAAETVGDKAASAGSAIVSGVKTAGENTKEAVTNAAKATSNAVKSTAEKTRNAMTQSADQAADEVDGDNSAEKLNRLSLIELPTGLSATTLSTNELLGTGVRGSTGDRIARVDDLEIGDDGQIRQVIMLSGGIAGFGANKAALAFDQVDLEISEDNAPRVSAAVTDSALEGVAAYEQAEMNDYSLASELIGAEARLNSGNETVIVHDIIVDQDGQVESLVIARSMIDRVARDFRVVPFETMSIAQGDGGVTMNFGVETFNNAATFSYARPKSDAMSTKPTTSANSDAYNMSKDKKSSEAATTPLDADTAVQSAPNYRDKQTYTDGNKE